MTFLHIYFTYIRLFKEKQTDLISKMWTTFTDDTGMLLA